MDRYRAAVERMRGGQVILIDGGTGTEVERRGVPQLQNAWNSGGTLSHPDIVRDVHNDYIHCGAEIVIGNTFATSLNLVEDAGVPELFEAYNRRAIELACEARDAHNQSQVLVAGSISHWSFSDWRPSLAELHDGAKQQALIMKNAGADLIMLEMMIDVPSMVSVLEGATTSGLPVWAGLSCAPDREGRMCLQAGEADANGTVQAGQSGTLEEAIETLIDRDLELINIMHTDVQHIHACLDVLEKQWEGLVGVYAHSGKFLDGQWRFEDTISSDDYASMSKEWLARGVNLIGGCCGIRPEHIGALREALRNQVMA
ncbi:MAG: homocysteine S-methyltransferase family protein [Pseudomonadota bacterium]